MVLLWPEWSPSASPAVGRTERVEHERQRRDDLWRMVAATGYGYVFLGEESALRRVRRHLPGNRRVGRVRRRRRRGVSRSPPGHDAGRGVLRLPRDPDVGVRLRRRDRHLAPARHRPSDGLVELYTETVDECNGVYGGDAGRRDRDARRHRHRRRARSRPSAAAAATRSRRSSTATRTTGQGTRRRPARSSPGGSIDATFGSAT